MVSFLRLVFLTAVCGLVLAACDSATDVDANRDITSSTTESVATIASDGALDFPRMRPGVSTNLLIPIRNTSADKSVRIRSIALRYGDRGFSVAGIGDEPIVLAPAGQPFSRAELQVVFDGQFPGNQARRDELVINGDTTNTMPIRVSMTATLANIVVTPNPIDMGVVASGTVKDRTVTVSLDDATSAMEITSVGFVTGTYFTVVDPPVLPMMLDATTPSVTFTVRCTPGAVAMMEDMLSVNGTGTAAVTASLAASDVDIYVEDQNLGTVSRETDIPIEVRVRNVSSASASVGSIRILNLPDGILMSGIGGFDGYPMTIPANAVRADDGVLRVSSTLPAGTYTVTLMAAIQAADTGARIREVGSLSFVVE